MLSIISVTIGAILFTVTFIFATIKLVGKNAFSFYKEEMNKRYVGSSNI